MKKQHKILLGFSLLQMVCSHGIAQENPARPNIVLILADDLGNRDVGFNGCEDIPTPNIDRIANEGVKFTSGYVTFAVCGPSRAAIMTGRYQDRFGFCRTPILAPNDPDMGLPATEQTLAEMLKSANYRTMLAGKWHLGAHAAAHHPNVRGFDEFFGFLAGGHLYFPEEWVLNTEYDAQNEYDGYKTKLQRNGQIVENETEYLTDALSREAVNFIKDNAENPFFLYLAYNAPHTPLQATSNYLSRFSHITDEKRRTYAAMVSAMDDGVGKVLNELDSLGISDNTIVFFLSDNGGPESVNGSDNGVLRGGKSSWFEGGIRVPFAMRWPEKIGQGLVYQSPVISLDIASTIVANIGQPVSVQNELDGINLMPYLENPQVVPPERTLFWRFYDGEIFAIRTGEHFKFLRRPNNPDALFNLKRDIGENKNLLPNPAVDYACLLDQLNDWLKDMKEPAFLGLSQIDEYRELQTP